MKITGDQAAGQEIVEFLNSWDKAICSLDMHEIVKHCAADVSFYDVTINFNGISAYQQLWHAYKDYFRKGLKVFRDNVNINAEPNIAFAYCLSKIDVESGIPTPGILWCRTSICFRKKNNQWKVIHQHISSPKEEKSIPPVEWRL
ncbi:nuclear transport factor 2 family protein [Acinetobacter sp.]|uniref:YybH family protein n=1 Tax=Acinetobacter sp. TaxID=472 RepID=UPI0035B0BFD3